MLKIKEGFVLRKVGEEQIVVTVGDAMQDLNGFIKLNGTGAFLWRLLEQGAEKETLAKELAAAYDISVEQAASDIETFLAPLTKVGCIVHV